MANQQSPNPSEHIEQQPNDPGAEEEKTGGGTFKTDVSETDEEGTTVREAEVREDDLSEVDKGKEGQHD